MLLCEDMHANKYSALYRTYYMAMQYIQYMRQLGLRMASYVHVGLVSISRAPFIPILPPGGGGVAVRGVVGWGLEANGFVLIVKRFVSGS